MPDKEVIETLASNIFLAIAAGLVTALLSKEPWQQKLKNFAATVVSGGILSWIMRNLKWQPQFKEFFIVICAAFIGTIWFQLEDLLKIFFHVLKFIGKKILEKKINIEIPDDVINNSKKDV